MNGPFLHHRAQKRMVISFRCGRLANRLILFANFVALAEERGYRLSNPTFQSYSEMFEGTRQNFWCEYPRRASKRLTDRLGLARALRWTRLAHHVARYTALLNARYRFGGRSVVTAREIETTDYTDLNQPPFHKLIAPASLVFIYGWLFRSPTLVRKHADKIRRYFTPVAQYETAARSAISALRERADIVVGVHIRHGDYRRWQGGRFFFEASQYAAWMRSVEALFPGKKVAFLVCSDEPRTADEFKGLAVGFGTDTPVGDLYALAKCDYIIGVQSTFTQWAAFYGDVPLVHLRTKDDTIALSTFAPCYLDWPC